MDILLINPYYSQRKEYHSFIVPAPPLALLYLTGYLRKYNVDCKICEFGVFDPSDAINIGERVRFGISDEEIKKIIKKENPKIVGITSMYSIYYADVVDIAKTIKKINNDIKIVLGGNHASSYYPYILKNQNIDIVVIGEGERAFLDLCNVLLNNGALKNIKGIAYKENGNIIKNEPAEVFSNLDEIPFPARDSIDFKKYIPPRHMVPYLMRYPAATIITSRGCPGKCVYCTVKAVWGRTWRGRGAKNVVDEIEMLVHDYGIKEIVVLDDSASINKQRWSDICDEIINRKIDIKWSTPNGIAHWTLDKNILDKMKKAGCYRVTFGIESGNAETRKFLGKPYSLQQAKEMLKYANKIGMWTICTNILGFPYEKEDSIRDTINFAKKCGTDFATFYLLIPQPTSDVYGYFKKENLLNLDAFFENENPDWYEFEKINYILSETGTDTMFFKKEELRRLQKNAYRSFIIYRFLSYAFVPWKILHKLNSWEDFLYCMKLFKNGALILFRLLNPFKIGTVHFLYKKGHVKKDTK
ncbi:MAG: radical SAM protein [Candidatus Firestonebacteria bacterium]